MQHPALVDPSERLISQWALMMQEAHADAVSSALGYHLSPIPDSQGYAEFLRYLKEQAQGVNLTPGCVPQSTFWLANENGQVIGESRVRHRLTREMELAGGQIGYLVRPTERRKGYGTLLLSLTLEKTMTLGLSRVLVLCRNENTGSARVIQNNGGRFIDEHVSPRSGKRFSRYWIDLPTVS